MASYFDFCRVYLPDADIFTEELFRHNTQNFLMLNLLAFDSYMTPFDDLTEGMPRLLLADKQLVIPQDELIRLIVTSNDVIHS
jgi:heme/copper-type cytochrome/quinol oxidase subunit 2